MVGVETAIRLLVVLTLVVVFGAIWWLDRDGPGWIPHLRQRLLFGIPWGTLVTVLLVLSVYLIIQGGLDNLSDPLTIPYVSWSYLYPLGWVTAPLAHSGLGHLTGNLIGTVLLGPLVEYAWSHYPIRRGSAAFDGVRRNPYVRAFIMFPVGIIAIGIFTTLFHWGPLIGFSGVVFALAGFGVVTFPITTVVLLSARGVLSTLLTTFQDPILSATPGPTFSEPWWAGIAVQGHLLGFLLGAILGIALLRYRNREGPSAGRVWLGTVLTGFSLTLWAIWWYGVGRSVILYRGLGVILVFAIAVLVATGIRGSRRDLLPEGRPLNRVRLGISRRRTAVLVLVLAVMTMGAIAVPVNLTTVQDNAAPADAIEVRDYSVFYAESVRNRNVPAIDIDLFGAGTNVTTSGVIVTSQSRHVWTRAVSAAELAFRGYALVDIGGPGWERTVDVIRQGWIPVGGEPVYRIGIRPPDGEFRQVFATNGSTAAPVISGRNISVGIANGTFVLAVSQNGTELDRAPIPEANSSVTLGGVTLRHLSDRIIALIDGTRVTVIQRETYS